jgi:hypothetical protein
MAQHDYILANQSGAAFRSDLNNGLAAIVSNNSGAAQPSTTYAYQWWAETNTGLLKIRNAANNAWITIGTLADANLGLLAQSGGTLTGALLADYGTAELPGVAFDGDPDTGVFRAGANKLGIATNGVERVEFGNAEVVFNDGGSNVDFRVEGATNADLFKIDAGLDQVQVANLNGGPLAGTRNRIINGNFDIAQRGTSFAAIANAAYSLDRWTWGQAGAMVCTVTQSTDVPNNTFQSSYKVDVTTVDSSIAAGDYAFISQKIEGYNVRDLIGTTFTVSFWVKSPKTGVHCVSFSNSGQNRSYIKEYTIAAVNTWEYKTVTVTGGLITAGTWNWTNGEGLEVGFSLATGSTYQTTSDAWQTGDLLGTASQVNVMDNTANDFFLTGVQLEPGPVATPFEQRPIGTELALCRRYYEEVNGEFRHDGTLGGTNISVGHTWFATVPKRTTATVSVLSESGSNVSNILAVTAKGSNGAFCVWEYTDGTSIITRNKAAIIKFVAEL